MVDINNFRGKVIAIAGGGGDIGSACAMELSRVGAKISLIDIDQGRLEARVDKLRSNGLPEANLFHMTGNCQKSEEVETFLTNTANKFKKIDVLINTVGNKRMKTLATCSEDDLDYVLDGNIKTYFLLCKTAYPHLIASGGNIVNVSSIAGLRPTWQSLPYTMAKAAVDQMTRCIATELAPKGVRCNAICPGNLKSNFNMRFGDCYTKPEQLEAHFDAVMKITPMKHIGTPEECVPSILFLASDAAGFITGTTMAVDGSYQNTSHVPDMKRN